MLRSFTLCILAEKRMKTLSILSIHSTKDLLGTCLPKSLKAWLKDNNIKFNKPKKDCLVNINEVRKKRLVIFSSLNIRQRKQIVIRKYWNKLDRKLKKDKTLKMFKKVKIGNGFLPSPLNYLREIKQQHRAWSL